MISNEDEEDEELTVPDDDGHHISDLKQKCFDMLPALFRKKSAKQYKESEDSSFRKHCSFEVLNEDRMNVPFPITVSNLIPGSPISPRVKNFNSDMRCLALSRKDNPYLSQQIERSNSLSSECTTTGYTLSSPIMSIRKATQHCYYRPDKLDVHVQLFNSVDDDATRSHEKDNLHDKLIRSPPPNFPEKLSQFLFTQGIIDDMEEDQNLAIGTNLDNRPL